MRLDERSPYTGGRRRLVIGIDVGTTFSGVSYSVLDPGQEPEIKGVNRQERVGGDSKVPSLVYYDPQGVARAFCAEALDQSVIEQAEAEGWVKVEWFKLHFRPKSLAHSHMQLPPLPFGKTVVDVFADIFRYLYACTRTYIRQTHANGDMLWDSVVERDINFVISHPNGWEGAQQAQLRAAVVRAGLIKNNPQAHARVQFVTEGEASLNFCIQDGLTTTQMEDGEGVVIVDAGGGTVDLSAYYVSLRTKTFEEIAPAHCYFQGSVFVTQRAYTMTVLPGKYYAFR